MPEPDTKLNKITKLQTDLSNTSFIHSNHILTCDASDTLFVNNTNEINAYRIYLNSKAKFYMHPYSQVRNCTTKFNNEKQLFKNVVPARVPTDASSSLAPIHTQKLIQNQVKVPASQYTNTLAALSINNENLSNNNKSWHNASDRQHPHGLKNPSNKTSINPNFGVDIKHNSYDRYLGRKKSQYLKTEPEATPLLIPSMGNKTRKFGVVYNNNKNCPETC